jgi:uncharacterized membrane protein
MSEMNQPGYQAVAPADAGATGEHFISHGRTVGIARGWEWLVAAFGLFKKQPGIWILLTLIYAACFFVIALVPVIGSLANLIVTPVFAAGLMIGCKALDADQPLEIGHLFVGFTQNAGNLVVLGVLSLAAWVAVLVIVGLIMGGGTIAAIMRGDPSAIVGVGVSMVIGMLVALALSIPIYMAMWFAPALIALHGMPAVDAMKASFAACLKNMMPFFVYGVVVVVAAMIAMIPFGLGLLVLVPVIVASLYTGYRDIFFEG